MDFVDVMKLSSFTERTIELGKIERLKMAKIGYARVSSADQNLDRQLEKLKGTERIFQESMSGAEKNRPQLSAMLDYIREGDIIVVTELERLGRNNRHLTEVMNAIHTKGATLEVLNLPTLQGIEDANLRRLLFNLIIEIYKYQAQAERKLEINPNQNMFLYDWLDINYDTKNFEQYDYVIIDCRPDFGIATRNAIAVSHAIINPIIPSDFAYEAKENLEIRLDNYRKTEIIRPSRESLITAKLFFLPNMIKHNTGKSKELMQALNNQENVLEFIPQKELFNKATGNMTMIDMMNTKEIRNEHKIFFKNIEKSLDQIELTIDEL